MLTINSKVSPIVAGKAYLGLPRPGGGGGPITTPPDWGQAGVGTSGDIMALRPAPGYLKSVHANTLSSVNPCPANNCWYTESSGQNGNWGNWCGAVLSPDYSTHGGMVYWGGGHGGYDGVEFYVFDLSTQLWSRLGGNPPTDFLPDTSADWCDVDYYGHKIPPASHTYSHPVYISPAQGGGTKGSWMLPFNVYGGGPGSGNGTTGYRPHAFDLARQEWRRFTTNTIPPIGPAYGGCFVHQKTNTFWGMATAEGASAVKIDLTQSTKTLESVNSVYAPSTYFVPIEVPGSDFMMACAIYMTPGLNDGQRTIGMTGYDLSSGKPADFNPSFAAPQLAAFGAGIGMDWCPDTGKFYLYEGFGTTKVYVATPPAGGFANWKTGTWTWSTETMLGETPVSVTEVQPSAQGAQVFTKWKYNPAIKCFMWSGGLASRTSPDGASRNGAFQLYRPLGT